MPYPLQSLAKVLALPSGNLEQTLKGYSSAIRALCMLPNGQLASGCEDDTIKLWDINSGTCIKTLTEEKTLREKDNATNKYLRYSMHTSLASLFNYVEIYSLCILPNGQLASSSNNNTISIWDINSGKCVQTLQGHTGCVHSLFILPNGQLASGSSDKTISIWDTNSGTCMNSLKGYDNTIYALCVLSNGQLTSGSANGTIKLQNAMIINKQSIQFFFEALEQADNYILRQDITKLLQVVAEIKFNQDFKPDELIDTCLEELAHKLVALANGIQFNQTSLVSYIGTYTAKAYLDEALLALTLLSVTNNALATLLYQVLVMLLKCPFEQSNELTAANSAEYFAKLNDKQQKRFTGAAMRLVHQYYELVALAKNFNAELFYKRIEKMRKATWLAGIPELSFYQIIAQLAIRFDDRLDISHTLNGQSLPYLFTTHQNLEALQWLTQFKLRYDYRDESGYSACMYAAKLKWLKGVQHLAELKQPGAFLLHDAIKYGNKALLEYGVEQAKLDINAYNEEVQTPLMVAVSCNEINMLLYLLSQQANVALKDSQGKTALALAKKLASKKAFAKDDLLFAALAQKNITGLQWVNGLAPDYNIKNSQAKTPSLIAADQQWIEGLQFLHTLNKQGASLTHDAITAQSLDLLRYAIEIAQLDINTQIEDGDTPLILAVKLKQQEAVEYLLSHQANAALSNKKGQTAVAIAVQNNDLDLVCLLHVYAKPSTFGLLKKVIPSLNSSGLEQHGLFAKNNLSIDTMAAPAINQDSKESLNRPGGRI